MWFLPLFSETAGGGDLNISCTLGVATADGFTANIDRQLGISGVIGTADASGFTAVVDRQLTISGSLATATADGFNASIDRQISVSGSLGQAIADGFLADITFAAYGGIYNAAYYFPTGGTVTIALYDPVTAGTVALDDNACVEMNTTGIFIWDTSKLTTQPDGYQEYVFKMTNGTLYGGGIINMCRLTTEEHNKLMAVPIATENASAVLAAATTTPIAADAKKMNGATITGDGTAGNLWRG